MVTAARDRLARTLAGEVKSASSVELTAAMDDLSLHVDGVGRVRFPLTPAKVRKLLDFDHAVRQWRHLLRDWLSVIAEGPTDLGAARLE
jgi:hypothetical protein